MERAAHPSQDSTPQLWILDRVPKEGLCLSFHLEACASRDVVLAQLAALPLVVSSQRLDTAALDPAVTMESARKGSPRSDMVVGLGGPLLVLLAGTDDLARPLPPLVGPSVSMPSTPRALWCWIRGVDRGELFHAGRELERSLAGTFVVADTLAAFTYREGRDLSGFVDGTENPGPDRAAAVAFADGRGLGVDGSSVVTVQRWIHDFDEISAISTEDLDACIGRTREDDLELDDAPVSAHVKRAAQESFSPEAFLLRRSMPWSEGGRGGLCFIAFGASAEPFVAIARRMVGLEDGIADGLFRMSRPVDGATYWCPPVAQGQLDLRALV